MDISTTGAYVVKTGDAVSINGRTYVVASVESCTAITIRPLRWYEMAWRWMKRAVGVA